MVRPNEEIDPVSGLSLAMGMFLLSMRKHGIESINIESRNLLLLMIISGSLLIVSIIIEREEERQRSENVLAAITEMVYSEFYEQNNRNRKRKMAVIGDNNNNGSEKKKRRACKHDHERAWLCIQQDYLGPDPIFTDRQFEEVFRLTKSAVERLIQACGNFEPRVFVPGPDAAGKPGIRPEVKVLAVLKCVAFGCSGVAFRDYHQMGRDTTSECIKSFFRAILADSDLRDKYLRAPSPTDARRISKLHEEKHGVPGMLMSLDCMHILWKNCPVGQQCHFKATKKNKLASVVLEAGVDWNCWFWHASCGHAGTNNDLNIWDVSSLQQQFLSPWWNQYVDFEFDIDGQRFHRLWCLVDGIYPALTRFVKTIPYTFDRVMELFIKWQEGARKDVERTFGVLVRKFQFLARPNEYWYLDDIKNQIYGCVLMHNMMVETRIERDEREDASMYALQIDGSDGILELGGGDREDASGRNSRLQAYLQNSRGLRPKVELVEHQIEILKQRWTDLYCQEGHARLQTAVMNHIAKNYVDYHGG